MLFLLTLIENSSKKFNKLYKKYKNYVFVVCNNILKDLNWSEDAMQETFLSLSKNLDKVEDFNSNKTKGYIAIIARNKSIDIYNKKNNLTFVEDIFFESEKTELDPLEDMYYSNLLKLIKGLKAEYSNILMLKFVHEMNYKDIAKSLDITESTARKRVERGKKALLSALEGEKNEK